MNSVVVIGRGGIGTTYAYGLSKLSGVDLRVAADEHRVERYLAKPFFYNEERLDLDYFTPNVHQAVDLIIIATKWSGYDDAMAMCDKLVGANTQILPLLNGLLAYERAVERFGAQRVLRGYYVGHTAWLSGNVVHQDGVYTTVFGEDVNVKGQYSERVQAIAALFEMAAIAYRVDDDMVESQWQKLIVNIGANQVTAMDGGMSYGEFLASPKHLAIAIELMKEAIEVARRLGVNGTQNMLDKALAVFAQMEPSHYSSMAQDVRNGRVTEAPLFSEYIRSLQF